jgi:SAM-dependent methyltransferase
VHGDANSIPLPSDSFDIVTCQTLLMHISDPRPALLEMYRVLKPGGILLCVEPENFVNLLNLTSLFHYQPVEDLVTLFEFWVRYERGLRIKKVGNNSIATLLPKILTEIGFRNLEVYLNDKCLPFFPPYDSQAQRTLIDQVRTWHDSKSGLWDRDYMRSIILAGGGNEADFEVAWELICRNFREYLDSIASNDLSAAGGGLTYLFITRKPSL